MVQLNDKVTFTSKRKITDSGQMIVPCAFARTGMQIYTADSLGLKDKDPNELVEVHREETDVFSTDSMESFRSVPVTIGHPVQDGKAITVTSKNSKELQVGMLEGIPQRDEDLLCGTLVIADQKAIDIIDDGTVELSAGYTCNIVLVDDKYYQKDIKANHIAIVEKGRAGSSCMIADTEETQIVTDIITEENNMAVKEETVVVDLADTVAKLTSDADVLQAKFDASEVKVTELTDALASMKDSLESEVKERTDVVLLAKDLTDIEDFSGKSVKEIKAMIVADVLKLDLTDKSDAYVEARLDILTEDKDKAPTKMAMELADSLETKEETEVVISARDAMIKRNLGEV